jgi:hypothetical protein
MPTELAKAAAEMGLPVSSKRYESETTADRTRRAYAYQRAMAVAAKSRPVILRSRQPK